MTLKIRAADAKEVGVGNPAEETCCYPNEINVTFPQLFVNRLSLATIVINWLAKLISWLYATAFSNKLNLWSDSNLSPYSAASIVRNCKRCDLSPKSGSLPAAWKFSRKARPATAFIL